jgi:hypothetical protein
MKQKSRITAIGLVLILTSYLPITCSAQGKEGKTNSSAINLTQEDYDAMLAVNNMKLYKFPIEIPEDQTCIVTLYKQEFNSQGIISDENIFGSNSPHVKIVDRQVVLDEKGNRAYTPLNGVRIITKDEGRDFSLGIKIGEFEIPSMPLKIDSIYLEKHFVKSYSIPNEFPIGSEIPLVLIGSAWKSTDVAEKNEMSKFCWGEFEGISPDFSQEQFKKMPHYIIFGIRVVEPR